jgi:UPF0716 family protein affecting phage T7 exclusion
MVVGTGRKSDRELLVEDWIIANASYLFIEGLLNSVVGLSVYIPSIGTMISE